MRGVWLSELFHAATIGGATALGRDDLGRLAVGAKADLVMLDLDAPGMRPVREADLDYRVFDKGRGVRDMEGQIVYQDIMIAEAQQRGMHSQGYDDAYLAAQETRVRFFHEVLNDWLNRGN